MRRTRNVTIESHSYCSACNRFTRGAIVRLWVKPDARSAVWLCLTCLRHMNKAAGRAQAAGGGR